MCLPRHESSFAIALIVKTRKEWVVTFKNAKATDKAKQTLYVFVTLDGTLAGANFTGQ